MTENWQERRNREAREKAMADRVVSLPASLAEEALLRNGERQFAVLDGFGLGAIDLLLTRDIYNINSSLRRGRQLGAAEVGTSLDWHGYASAAVLVEHAVTALDRLGPDLDFDRPLVVHRGIGLAPLASFDPWDFWDMHSALDSDVWPVGTELTDPGFAFASPDALTASLYRGRGDGVPNLRWGINFELVVRRGLCIPGPEIRSRELMDDLYEFHYLRDAISQVIIPPVSRWKLIRVSRGLTPDVKHIVLEQI